MSRIIALANQKGGVGKTTTAVNMGAALALSGVRVLLVDIDPQGNASSGLGLVDRNGVPTIYDVLIRGLPVYRAIQKNPNYPNMDLLPANRDLAGAEIELVGVRDREAILKEALAVLGDDAYDYILVDCPPSLGLLTLNTLVAADSVLIPIQCEFYALEGLTQLLNTIRLVQRNLNPDLVIEGVLLTMYDRRLNLSRQVAAEAHKYFGDKVFETVIPRNVRLAEAPSFGRPIVEYDPDSLGSRRYTALAHELRRAVEGRALEGDPGATERRQAGDPSAEGSPPGEASAGASR